MTEDVLKQRKQMLTDLFQDKTYTPMKLKELAAFLEIPRSQRDELKEVLDIEKGQVRTARGVCPGGSVRRPCQRFWIRDGGGTGTGRLYTCGAYGRGHG